MAGKLKIYAELNKVRLIMHLHLITIFRAKIYAELNKRAIVGGKRLIQRKETVGSA